MGGAKKWKGLSEQARKPFEDKSAAQKVAYEKAMEKFKAAGGEVGKRRADKAAKRDKRDAKRARKESGMPKRPANAYQIYVNEIRPDIMKKLPKGSTVAAIGKEAGERWKAVSATEKEKYQKMFEKNKIATKKSWQHGRQQMPIRKMRTMTVMRAMRMR